MKKLMSVLAAAAVAVALTAPAMAAKNTMAKDVFKILNDERVDAGLEKLAWSDELAEAAQQRARELSNKYVSDHTRPDGSKYYTVSPLVWGENSAYGQKTADAVMEGFMASPSHQDIILQDRWTICGVGYVETSNSTYWVQLFGPGTSNSDWTGIDWDTKETAHKFANSSGKASITMVVDDDGCVVAGALNSSLKIAMAETKTGTVTVRVKDAESISADTIKTLAATEKNAGRATLVNFDTMNASGKGVSGRMSMDPAALIGRTKDLKVGVLVDKASVAGVRIALEKKYSGKLAFVHLEQSGKLGASVKITAKVNLSGMDEKSLIFYNYDVKTGDCTAIAKPDYALDSNGFLTFYTSVGGTVVITDTALK